MFATCFGQDGGVPPPKAVSLTPFFPSFYTLPKQNCFKIGYFGAKIRRKTERQILISKPKVHWGALILFSILDMRDLNSYCTPKLWQLACQVCLFLFCQHYHHRVMLQLLCFNCSENFHFQALNISTIHKVTMCKEFIKICGNKAKSNVKGMMMCGREFAHLSQSAGLSSASYHRSKFPPAINLNSKPQNFTQVLLLNGRIKKNLI